MRARHLSKGLLHRVMLLFGQLKATAEVKTPPEFRKRHAAVPQFVERSHEVDDLDAASRRLLSHLHQNINQLQISVYICNRMGIFTLGQQMCIIGSSFVICK